MLGIAAASTPRLFTAARAKLPRRLSAVRRMSTGPGSDWVAQDRRRMLHAVFRVNDLDESVRYYRDVLGMKVTRRRDVPEEKYSLAFMAYGAEDTHFGMELTYNHGVSSYDLGKGFGHFAIATNDVYALVENVRSAGGNVTREPGPVKGGTTHIAFVRDPSDYQFELIQREGRIPEPLAQVMLRVGDLDRSIKFYTEVLGLKLIRRRDNPEYKYTLAFLGYKGDESAETVFELTYNWGVSSYELGNAFAQVAISTQDVYKTTESARQAGARIVREPGELPGLGTKIMALTDPDGYKLVFVDEADFAKELDDAAKKG